MTYAEQVELAKTCTTFAEFQAKAEFQRGREQAKADIAAGEPNMSETYPYTAELFGEQYAKGYAEYYHAWEVLNRA